MTREILRMLSQNAVDYPTFPVHRRYFHFIVIQEGLLSRPWGMLSRNDKPADIWNSQGISGNVFANPRASSSSHSGGFNPWISDATEDTPIVTSAGQPVTCGERQIPDTTLNPRFQPGRSAGNSFDPKKGRFLRNYGADQQRLQISELHFDKFPTPATFACWKIRFKTQVCTCSQFPTEAMQWIKEVELVDSVDEFEIFASSSTRGISMPNFLKYLMRGLLQR